MFFEIKGKLAYVFRSLAGDVHSYWNLPLEPLLARVLLWNLPRDYSLRLLDVSASMRKTVDPHVLTGVW